jgi:putative ABC transport system permease protein
MTAGAARRPWPLQQPASPEPLIPPSHVHPGDLLGLGLVGLRTRRLRGALTATGIAIGICAMVAVLAISESSRADLLAQIDRLGTNLLRVTAGRTFLGEEAALPEGAEGMIARIGPVESASSTAYLDATVRRTDLIAESQTGGIAVLAADTDLLGTLRGEVARGRFLDAATERLPAVVLGWTAASRLGIGAPGVRVWIGGEWFTVIGILAPVALATELDSAAVVGFPVASELWDHDGAPGTVYVRSATSAVGSVRAVLGRTANPEDPTAVDVTRPSDALEARAAAATAFTALFVGLGAVALIVGGVGIANVMLMSVLERRSEIGLRRALGATRRHIGIQFVTEALVLAGLGGLVGICAGSFVGIAYATARGWTPVVPAVALVGGLVAALAIGAVAGLYPAWRAARMSPTDALRGS